MKHKNSGFTLIELMIVVIVIGVLAAIAIPAYQNYVLKSRRADAKAGLTAVQLAEEKWRTNHTSYTNALASLGFVADSGVFYSPDRYYALTVPSANANTYNITATAFNTSPQSKDTNCISFTLDQNGNKTSKNSSNAVSTGCW